MGYSYGYAFKDKEKAEKLKKELEEKGHEVNLMTGIPGFDGMWVVRDFGRKNN